MTKKQASRTKAKKVDAIVAKDLFDVGAIVQVRKTGRVGTVTDVEWDDQGRYPLVFYVKLDNDETRHYNQGELELIET